MGIMEDITVIMEGIVVVIIKVTIDIINIKDFLNTKNAINIMGIDIMAEGVMGVIRIMTL
jgi:hypothetical protein